MGIYIARRLLWLPFLLLAASLITFSLGRFGPGDPVRVMLGNRYDEQIAARIRHEMGLDRPFAVQYADYMWGFVRGDFGVSLRYVGQPVRNIILPKMWVSAQLAMAAMVVLISSRRAMFVGEPNTMIFSGLPSVLSP